MRPLIQRWYSHCRGSALTHFTASAKSVGRLLTSGSLDSRVGSVGQSAVNRDRCLNRYYLDNGECSARSATADQLIPRPRRLYGYDLGDGEVIEISSWLNQCEA